MPDNNFYSIADQDGITIANTTIGPCANSPTPGIADVFKLSHATNILVYNIIVIDPDKQLENAIDMNRECAHVRITNARLYSGHQNAITIKGGCEDIVLENVSIVPGTGNCEVEIGNWSDQSYNKSRQIVLNNITRTDGKPVRLRVGRSEYPVIIGGNVKYAWFESIMLKSYWWVQRFYTAIKFKSWSKHL